MSRQGAYWTESEISALLNAIKTNVSMYEIRNIHGRTEGAIISMLRKIASTYHFRDKLPISQIQELTGLSEKTVNTVISEGPRVGKTDYIKRMKPIISQTMEFPITIQRLHHIGDEYRSMRKKEIVNKFVVKFTKDIIELAWKSSSIAGVSEPNKKDRRYVVYGNDIDIDAAIGSDLVEFPRSDCVTEIVIEMKKRFPDMVIVQDPLGTYILFDWN
jgi:hypothetical protein